MWRRVAAVQLKGWTSTSQMDLHLLGRSKMMSLSDPTSQAWVYTMKSSRNSNSNLTTANPNQMRGSTLAWTLDKTQFQTRWTTLSTLSEPTRVPSKQCTTTKYLSRRTQSLAASVLRKLPLAPSQKPDHTSKSVTWRTSMTKRACISISTRCRGRLMEAPSAYFRA